MSARQPRGSGPGGRRKGRRTPLLKGVFWLAAAAVLAALCWTWATWPDVAALRTRDPGTTAYIERYLRLQRERGLGGRVAWWWVPYDAISPDLKRAVLVAEDINFFSHRGFDLGQVKVAVTQAIEERALPRGASTITQQLARNLWLSPSRNPWRKLQEALLTVELERRLTKRRMLELYLNVVEFGPGVFGAEAAARQYFGKPASDLSEEEAAALAAALPDPRRFNPESPSRSRRWRVDLILRRMEKAEFLFKLI